LLAEEKHMTLDRNLKIGIIASIIASFLFIYFLDPLLKFVTFLLFNVFRSLAHGYTDRLFEQAALLTAPDPSFHLLSLTLGFLTGFSITVLVVFLFLYNMTTDWLLDKIRSFPISKVFIRWSGM
jgi:hypothetical protein